MSTAVACSFSLSDSAIFKASEEAAGEEDLSSALDGDGVVDTGEVAIGEADQDIVEVRFYHVGSAASSLPHHRLLFM
jgi:hypothetical protein